MYHPSLVLKPALASKRNDMFNYYLITPVAKELFKEAWAFRESNINGRSDRSCSIVSPEKIEWVNNGKKYVLPVVSPRFDYHSKEGPLYIITPDFEGIMSDIRSCEPCNLRNINVYNDINVSSTDRQDCIYESARWAWKPVSGVVNIGHEAYMAEFTKNRKAYDEGLGMTSHEGLGL